MLSRPRRAERAAVPPQLGLEVAETIAWGIKQLGALKHTPSHKNRVCLVSADMNGWYGLRGSSFDISILNFLAVALIEAIRGRGHLVVFLDDLPEIESGKAELRFRVWYRASEGPPLCLVGLFLSGRWVTGSSVPAGELRSDDRADREPRADGASDLRENDLGYPECPVCLEDVSDGVFLQCGHTLCSACARLLEICPLCRACASAVGHFEVRGASNADVLREYSWLIDEALSRGRIFTARLRRESIVVESEGDVVSIRRRIISVKRRVTIPRR